MLKHDALTVRGLHPPDITQVRRVLETSEYLHSRFEPEELPHLLETYPAAGAFSVPPGPLARVSGGTLQAFLLVNWLVPPSAWIGGFGVTWSQGAHFERFLDPLLARVDQAAAAAGARMLYYSGGDLENDWLRASLEARGFCLVTLLRSYDKTDFRMPSAGNQVVRVRPYQPSDTAAVMEVERHAFAQRWRHDAASFAEVARAYPYFVVAEDERGVVGYQFNTLDTTTGYLVRIAVHPRATGQGIGTRLLAEAVRYFQRQHILRIALNTEEGNTRAHALYEWFGFEIVSPRGFVLGRAIPAAEREGGGRAQADDGWATWNT
ncbi:MAG: GNAT family N-acetyltransferase [Ktedonobacterales bacterium]|nr:GNAT family N-acetyltransferase [Ktedonobacterales bacterium]